MTLDQFFRETYKPLRLRGKSPGTDRLYGATLRAFGRFLGRDPLLADLDELTLSRFLDWRSTVVSPLTVEKERTQLVALAGLAFERRLLDVKPQCPPGPIPDRIPTAWSVDELRRIATAAADPASYGSGGDWKSRFFPPLVSALYETGERVGAMLEARIEDYRRPNLLIRAEARKGRKRDRVYRLTPETCDSIERAIGGRPEGLVFEWPQCRSLIWNAFGKVVRVAGLDGKRVRFHAIRRSAASHFAAAGGDAVEMLDHSSPRITRRWYIDPRIADRAARPCDVLPPIFRDSLDEAESVTTGGRTT